jgi:hypothetical protein
MKGIFLAASILFQIISFSQKENYDSSGFTKLIKAKLLRSAKWSEDTAVQLSQMIYQYRINSRKIIKSAMKAEKMKDSIRFMRKELYRNIESCFGNKVRDKVNKIFTPQPNPLIRSKNKTDSLKRLSRIEN